MFSILKNNQKLKHDEDVVQYYGEMFRLYIGEATTKDDAIYEIVATNACGEDRCKVEVEVKYHPCFPMLIFNLNMCVGVSSS